MNRLSHGRVKRVTAEFRGDEAIEIELLEVKLRMGDVARTRIEADTQLVRLALKALAWSIEDYSARTGSRYPPYRVLSGFLSGERTATDGDAGHGDHCPRVVGITK